MPFRPRYTGLIDRYRDRLPVHDDTRIISLGEGNTPLIRLHNIPSQLGKDVDIYVKYEGLNPTGSFKDRGMTMAVTKAVEEGSRAIICSRRWRRTGLAIKPSKPAFSHFWASRSRA
ncbi:MAG: pyridoxal-phosphate dependent enzyme, partial [Gammaproteobacteria bacterium]